MSEAPSRHTILIIDDHPIYREGLRRFVARGVPPREAGGTIAGLFIDPVYQQLVVSAWLGLETLPQ